MTSHEILKADVLDILFESRNKQYGAYTLRKGYNARLCKALAIALSTMLLLLFLFQPGTNESAYDEEGNKDVKVITLDPIPKIPKPPIKPTPPPPKAAQSSYVQNIKMVQNPDPKTEMKPVEEIKLTGISGANKEGPQVTSTQIVGPSAGDNNAPPKTDKKNEPEFKPIEKQPEFPGGQQAWVNFLNRYLQTPDELDAGEKRLVQISFMVDADGSVTAFKVVQSGGAAFDNEVIRVLKKMPKWKPAIQNGHPIAVPFTQPVTFVAAEQ